MARHYDLNKLRLEADDDGFTLVIPETENTMAASVEGLYDSPEEIHGYKLRKDVVHSYESQVERIDFIGVVDEGSTRGAVYIETQFNLKPGTNWFELDHSKFNEVYGA